MSAHKAAHPDLGAPTVPSVSRLLKTTSAPPSRPPRGHAPQGGVHRQPAHLLPHLAQGAAAVRPDPWAVLPWARTIKATLSLAHRDGGPSSPEPEFTRHGLPTCPGQASLGALALGSGMVAAGRPRVLALGALMVLLAGRRPALQASDPAGAPTSWQGQHWWFTGKLGQAARLIWAPCAVWLLAGSASGPPGAGVMAVHVSPA